MFSLPIPSQTIHTAPSAAGVENLFMLIFKSDIDLINRFVIAHKQDLQDSLSGIQDSVDKAILNVQWNDLHGEKVLQWLTENYGKDDHSSAPVVL